MRRELSYEFQQDEIELFKKLIEDQEHAESFDVMTFLQFDSAPLRTLYELLDIPWPFKAPADETMVRIYEDQWAKRNIWDLWTLVGMGLVSAEIRGEEVTIRPSDELHGMPSLLKSPKFLVWKLAFDRLLAIAYTHFSRYGKLHPSTILEASNLQSDLDDFTLNVLSSLALRNTPFTPTTRPPGNLPVTEEEIFESRTDLLGLQEFVDTALFKQDALFQRTVWLRFKQGESADEVAADLDAEDLLADLVMWRSTIHPWPSTDVEH